MGYDCAGCRERRGTQWAGRGAGRSAALTRRGDSDVAPPPRPAPADGAGADASPRRRSQRGDSSRSARRVELDAAEVLGTDEPVLVGADQPGRRAMVTVERTAIETLCDEHVLRQGVLDRHERPVAVETAEDDVSDRRVRLKRRLDDHAMEGLERDSLPVQVGGGPPSHAVKVGGELSAGKRRELGQWQGEGFAHGAGDLDHRIDGDSGKGAVEVRTEAREPIDGVLAGGKRHTGAPCQDAERVPARQSRSTSRRSCG